MAQELPVFINRYRYKLKNLFDQQLLEQKKLGAWTVRNVGVGVGIMQMDYASFTVNFSVNTI